MILKQLEEKNEFLKRAYDVAYEYAPSSPLSVNINPVEFGKSIGHDKEATKRIMNELVADGFVTSSLGMGMLIVTKKGLDYLRSLEIDTLSPPVINFSVGDNSNVQFQHGTVNSNQYIMKQSEKLDLILKALYTLKDTGYYHSIVEICQQNNIPLGLEEWNRLSHRLENDGFVNTMFHHNDCNLKLTTHGIEYCEENSYTYSGKAIINNHYNISVVNSPNSNIVSNSNNVNITQQNEIVNETLKNIKSTLQNDPSINSDKLEEILECVNEIEHNVKSGNSSKFAIKSLLEIGGNIASIASYLTALGQIIGIIKK